MTGKPFGDTNILIYAIDPSDPRKRTQASDLLRRTISNRTLTLSPQSLNECYRVLTDRRHIMPVVDARAYVRSLAPWATAPLDASTTQRAWEVQDRTKLSWWDSLLLTSALQANCTVFLSEDLHDGLDVFGMRVMNPFAPAFAQAWQP